MEEQNTQKKTKLDKKKILIPLTIVIIVFGIWFFKSENDSASATIVEKANENSSSEKISSEDTLSENILADNTFDLLITENLDIEELKSYGLPIIIDFGSDSCVPCKEMAPVLAAMNQEYQGRAIIKFVDVWEYPELAEGLPIRVIPTQLFIDKDGNPYLPSETLELPTLLYTDQDTEEHIFTAHEGGLTEEMFHTILMEMGVEE